jgi:hypothetical protein
VRIGHMPATRVDISHGGLRFEIRRHLEHALPSCVIVCASPASRCRPSGVEGGGQDGAWMCGVSLVAGYAEAAEA